MSDTEVLDAPASLTEFNPVQKGLAELRKELAGVQFDVTTTAGDKAARAARSRCVSIRTAADAAYEDWNKPMLAKQREMRAILSKIKEEVKAIEEPIDAQIKAEERRKAAIKAERERIERERQEAIQARITALSQYPVRAVGKPSAQIAKLRDEVASLEITEEIYGQRGGEAIELQSDVAAKLNEMHAAALAQEAEAARLAAERAELERQRQEQEAAARAARQAEEARLQAEREAFEKARREEEARQAQARAEEQRRQEAAAAELRRQREELDRQRREIEAEKEAARRAEEEKAEAVARAQREKEEADRRAAEAAERERMAEAARREAEEFALKGPGEAEILRVLAEHYDVDTDVALNWIISFDIHHIPA